MSVNYLVDWASPATPSLAQENRRLNALFMKHWSRFASNSMRYRNSLWPAKQNTANRGPYSKQKSVGKFTGQLEKNGDDYITHINNSAKNKKGLPYAYFVNRGVSSRGRVSKPRFTAN